MSTEYKKILLKARERNIASDKSRTRIGCGGSPLEQVTGIEPARSAWEADVLPLYYTCIEKFCIIFVKQHS